MSQVAYFSQQSEGPEPRRTPARTWCRVIRQRSAPRTSSPRRLPAGGSAQEERRAAFEQAARMVGGSPHYSISWAPPKWPYVGGAGYATLPIRVGKPTGCRRLQKGRTFGRMHKTTGDAVRAHETRYEPGDRVWVGQSRGSMREATVLRHLEEGSYVVAITGQAERSVHEGLLSRR